MPKSIQSKFYIHSETTILCQCNSYKRSAFFLPDLILTSADINANCSLIKFDDFLQKNLNSSLNTCVMCHQFRTTKINVQTSQYLIIKIARPQSLKITNLDFDCHYICGSFWKLIGLMEYIPTKIMQHYVTWIRMNETSNDWLRIDDNYVSQKTLLNYGLENYNVLVFEIIV